jgi:hypothetical protein
MNLKLKRPTSLDQPRNRLTTSIGTCEYDRRRLRFCNRVVAGLRRAHSADKS